MKHPMPSPQGGTPSMPCGGHRRHPADPQPAPAGGVLGHELGHVKHRDILNRQPGRGTSPAIMFLSRFAGFFGARDEEGRSNPIAGIAIMILGPWQRSCFRWREPIPRVPGR